MMNSSKVTSSVNAGGYYENVREELLPLVDTSFENILDVGCGAGYLGEALKMSVPGRQVHGIEIVERIADEARLRLDSVTVGDFQTLVLPFPDHSMDCIVFADVLEHLAHPEQALRRARTLLRPSGAIVCSIPNIRHYTAIMRLVLHGWEYDSDGLFDRTHLRFFSLQSMRSLLESEGWRIEIARPRIVASKKLRMLNALFFGRLEEFVSWQYLIRARLPEAGGV